MTIKNAKYKVQEKVAYLQNKYMIRKKVKGTMSIT